MHTFYNTDAQDHVKMHTFYNTDAQKHQKMHTLYNTDAQDHEKMHTFYNTDAQEHRKNTYIFTIVYALFHIFIQTFLSFVTLHSITRMPRSTEKMHSFYNTDA